MGKVMWRFNTRQRGKADTGGSWERIRAKARGKMTFFGTYCKRLEIGLDLSREPKFDSSRMDSLV
jgi:hypothetical protein